MTRLAAARRVYAFEPMPQRARLPLVGASQADGITVLTPYLPGGVSSAAEPRVLAPLVESVLEGDGASMPILWICDAHSFPVVAGVPIAATVHDAGPPASISSRPAAAPGCWASPTSSWPATPRNCAGWLRGTRACTSCPTASTVRPGTPPSTRPAAWSTTWSAPSTPATGGCPAPRADGARYSPPLAPPPDPGDTHPGRRRW